MAEEPEEEPKTTIDDEEKAATEQRFQQQCYLMENCEKYQAFNKSSMPGYKRFAILNGEPSVIINELTKRPNVEELFEMSPYQLSLLVPTLRLFKVEYKSELDREGKDIELEFASHESRENIDNITKNRRGRGTGVGIQSFEWDYFGKNPAEATTNINAHLTIFFQNIEDLVSEGVLDQEGGTAAGKASFSDLFIFSKFKRQVGGTKECENRKEYNPKRFRIKAVVGWALPPKNDIIGPDLRAVLGSMQTVLMLDLVKHSIDFNENGTLVLKAEYIGSVENSLNHTANDILALGEKQKQAAKDKKPKSKCKDPDVDSNPDDDDDWSWPWEDTPEEKEAERVKGELAKERVTKYNRLLQKLKDTNRIFFVDVPKSKLGVSDSGDQLTRKEQAKKRDDPNPETPGEGPKPQKAESTPPIDDAIEKGADEDATPEEVAEEVSEVLSQSNEAAGPDKVRINFLYYGDIINTVLEVLESPENPVPLNTGLIMGPLTFYDKRIPAGTPARKRMFNLADIPISLDLFTAWWTDKVLKSGGRNNYFLKDFLRDTVKDLISAAISGGCTKANLKQSDRIGINVIISRGTGPEGKTSRIKTHGSRQNVEDIADAALTPLPSGAERKPNQGIHHYIFVFSSSEPADMFNGNREEDFRRGIYHLGIGEERGILKSIKFSQIQQKHLKEANYTRDDVDGDGAKFFRERYNADVELFGNVLFYPGSMVYINPSITGLGSPRKRNSLAQRMGIGGYYLVKDVKNSIGDSGFQTSISCIWTNPGEGNEKAPREPEDDGDGGILGAVGDLIPGGKGVDLPGITG
jgi:hypothetical protein